MEVFFFFFNFHLLVRRFVVGSACSFIYFVLLHVIREYRLYYFYFLEFFKKSFGTFLKMLLEFTTMYSWT